LFRPSPQAREEISQPPEIFLPAAHRELKQPPKPPYPHPQNAADS